MSQIKSILANNKTLNLYENEKRLILKALIKTNFNINDSHLLNAPEMNFLTYQTKVSRLFSIKKLRKEYAELVAY